MNRHHVRWFAATFFLWPAASPAVDVAYSTVALGGGDYRYDYTLLNTGGAVPLKLVDLLFDPALYDEASLADLSSPALGAGWSTTFLASAPGVPAAFDVLATAGGVPAGGSLGGFAVRFHWLGSGAPGAQGFEVYDPSTFSLLETGSTSAVPEPPAAGLALAGLLLAAALVNGRLRRPCV